MIGLITNNYETDVFEQPGCRLDGAPLAIQFARLAQLFVVLVAATSAVFALLRTQFDRVAVRFARRTFLVVGADESSSVLLPALAAGAAEMTRVVLTPDPAAPWVPRVRAGGWRVVVGDPESPDLLRSLLLRRGGRRVLRGLAVLPPDSATSGRLVRAVEDVMADSTGVHPVRALLRIDDAWQAEDWRRRYLGQPDRWVVDTISANEVTALLLLRDALDRGADHLVLVGRSDLTFALLAEVAQLARERVLDDLGPVPPVVLVGPAAERMLTEHELAERGFGNQSSRSTTVVEDAGPETVAADLLDRGYRPALFFTGAEDAEDQRLAARLGAMHPRLLVYSRVPGLSGLGLQPLLAQVRGFGVTLEAGKGRPIDRWERIARLLHARFIAANPDPSRASRRPWDEGLPAFYRESNVRQVTTVLGSAIAVGRSWGATGVIDPAPPTADQLDEMARADHESWRRHHEENGWRWAAHRDDEARRHPDLVGWEQLGEEGRSKTRAGVATTLRLLETLGYRSFDDPEAEWRRFRRLGEVDAVRRTEPWEWTSGDGTVLRGEAGDWEVSDASGSRSVAAETFEQTHQHLSGDRWRRTGEVEARRARPGEVIHSPEGTATARDDQWVLRGSADEQWLVSEGHLARAYEPVDDAQAMPRP